MKMVRIIGDIHGEGRVYPAGFGDSWKKVEVNLPPGEYAALVMLRDTLFKGRSLEMVARKLMQDEMIRAGALSVPTQKRPRP